MGTTVLFIFLTITVVASPVYVEDATLNILHNKQNKLY